MLHLAGAKIDELAVREVKKQQVANAKKL